MTNDLFLAILAMDAYNRTGTLGTPVGLKLPDGTLIGNATVLSGAGGIKEDLSSGFLGQAYDLNGWKIISYRGTDTLPSSEWGNDVVNGWPLGDGGYAAKQATLAAQFFQQVVGNGNTNNLTLAQLYNAGITLTGHSLGGGLAGFIASIYGQTATVFDSMNFSTSAASLMAAIQAIGQFDPETGQALGDPDALQLFFLNNNPSAINSSGVGSYAVQQQILSSFPPFSWFGAQSSFLAAPEYDLGFSGILSGSDRHSQSLLAIRMYADQTLGIGSDWLAASRYVLPELFNDKVAVELGLVTGNGTGTGTDSASGKMRTMIAYSALDDGAMIYGNTGIRALYDDENELGRLVSANDTAAYLKDPSHVGSNILNALGDIITEYAGLLANNKSILTGSTSGSTGYEKGALYYDQEHNRLIGDFSPGLWQITDGPKSGQKADIVGLKTLTDAVATNGAAEPSSINEAVNKIWNGKTDNIVKLVAQTNDANNVVLDAIADAQISHGGAAQPTDGAMLVGGGGSNTISGSSGDDLLIGGGGNDLIYGMAGNDLMFGGTGNDTFLLGRFPDDSIDTGVSDWIDGGAGIDTADYTLSSNHHVLGFANIATPKSPYVLTVTDTTTGKIDYLVSVESIKLDSASDIMTPTKPTGGTVGSTTTIDFGATAYASGDVLDFSNYGTGGVYLSSGNASGSVMSFSSGGSEPSVALYADENFTKAAGLQFQDFNTLILTSSNDKVELHNSDNPYLHQLYTGKGSDAVWSDIINLQINTATDAGDVGRVEHAGQGSVINLGDGRGEIFVSDDVLVVHAKATDVFASVGGKILHGGTGTTGSESKWVTGPDGTRYGINSDGQLAIMDKSGATMFIADYKGGPDVPFDQQTGSIFVGLVDWDALRLVDFTRPGTEYDTDTIKAGNALVYVKLGHKFFDSDPLVLDLNGDGIHLTPASVASPIFDINNTGFGIHTGWVQPDDGMLFYDKNSNGQVDSGRELFGGQGAVGFDALDNYDLNADGVIDANDAIYSQLQVWRDINGNAVADTGELQSLAALGITSISLTTTAPENPDIAGNTVNALGTFTRADGSTGTIAGVSFNSDPFHSVYLGDKTVSTAAAALPNLKGFGTLADLRVAMTLDPTLIDVVNANLPNLTSLDLNELRAAALPIFAAWAAAVPLLDADGNPQPAIPSDHRDVPILVDSSSGAPSVIDFAYFFTDENNVSYWKLASGNSVLNSLGVVIAHPTFEQILAQTSSNGQWQDFTAGEISFMERYMGQAFPFELLSENPGAVIGAMTSLIGGSWSAMQLEAVRLAVQGPLASYFNGIEYDAADNMFRATTDLQLTPMYQAIFNAAPADAPGALSWLEQWRPIVDIVLGDFERTGGVAVSHAYLFASMVRAYETVPLPFDIETAAVAFGVPEGLIFEGGSTVTGTSGADILYLHGGDQIAQGGLGLDNYVIGGQFNNITIDDFEGLGGHQDPDILRFTSIRSTDVTATRDGIDLILTVNATGQQITVLGEFTGVNPGIFGGNFNPDRGVAQVAFADGVVWDMPDISWAVSHPQPTASTIAGTSAMDVLDGGVGGDTYITGGNDGDIYLFGRGYGHDTVDDLQTNPLNDPADYVMFNAGVARSDVTFYRIGDSADLQIGINGTSDLLTVAGQFGTAYNIFGPMWFNRVEAFIFSDGSTYNWEQIIRTMDAHAGTSGNDTIYGFNYEDVLDGGAGDDFISGENENDTYIFGVGDGHDTILEGANNILAGMTDTLEFREGVLPTDVTYTRDGSTDDLIITLASGDSIRIEGQFGKSYGELWFDRIENFKFDSTGDVVTYEDIMQRILDEAKTSGDDTIYGYYREDVMDGGAGNDYLAGGREGDTYIWGKGWDNDTIYDLGDGLPQGDNIDKVEFSADLTPDDIAISREGASGELVLTIRDTGETLTVQNQFLAFTYGQTFYQIEEFHFSDGTVWGADYFRPVLLEQAKTAGDDVIYGFNTSDRLDGGAGNDVLHGGGGGDTFVYGYGYGNDTIDAYINFVSWDFPDTVEFSAGVGAGDVQLSRVNDIMIVTLAGSGEQLTILDQFGYYGYSRVENFDFTDGTRWSWEDVQLSILAASETSGDDLIVGYKSDDTLDGGAGNDLLIGGAGNDTYVFGRGYNRDIVDDDSLSALGNAPDRVVFKPGIVLSDLEFIRIQDDVVIRIIGTSDQLTVKNLDNNYLGISTFEFADGTILTASDVDTIISNNPPGMVTHLGLPADETIVGSPGDDVIDGLSGNDLLQGGAGGDTYLYRVGSGNDRIEDTSFDPGIDQLSLVDLNASDVAVTRVGNDAIVRVIQTGETVTAVDQFLGSSNGVEQIKFADGTIWDRTDIQTHALIFGTIGDDSITGTGASETFDALGGNDTIDGGGGSDTYIFGVGSGNDTINEYVFNAGTDIARLVGLNVSDVTFSRSGYDLFIAINSSGETLKAFNQFHSSGDGIDQIEFADGTIWDSAQILAAVTIYGTAGNDTLNGSGDDDVFDGGPGNDTLNGGAGSDTYIYGVGSGNDTINEASYLAGTDTAKLLGLNSSDVTFSRTTYDLFITINSSGETLKAFNQFHDPGNGLDQVEFADGTIWDSSQIASAAWYRGTSGNDSLTGSGDSETFDGGAGNDTIDGSSGSDTYIYGLGSGNDTINEVSYLTGTDTAKLIGLNAADVTFSRSGYDLFITINSSGETLKAFNQFHSAGDGIDRVEFADGTIWDSTQIASAAWYRGTSGNDSLTGSGDSETFDGGSGNDTIDGGAGSDTYIFGIGSGNDTINEASYLAGTDTAKLIGLNPSDISVSRTGYDLFITINSSGETLKAFNQFHDLGNGLDQVEFADGTIWNSFQLAAAAWYRGTSGADTISGDGADNTFDGGAGDDAIDGGAGSDTYIFGVGSGNDTITEYGSNAGTDGVRLIGLNSADVTISRQGYDVLITINSSGEVLKVFNHFHDAGNGIDQLQFADSTVWNRTAIEDAANASIADDQTINGTSGNDTLHGGAGNDILNGGGGGDTYLYGVGSGNDTVNEYYWDAGTDTIQLTGLNSSDLTFSRVGYDLIIKINSTGKTLTASNQFADGGYGVEQIQFADNTIWDRSQISAAAWVRGTTGNDSISGTNGDETFDGGAGNDTITGGAGSDTYVYGIGSGNDTVNEYYYHAGTDTAKLAGLDSSDVTFSRSGNDLFIAINSSGETLKASDQFADGGYGLDQVHFADDTIWDRSQISAAAWVRGTSGNDSINGTNGDETFDGGAGNDTIAGAAGSDTYIFGLGSGSDTINEYYYHSGTDTAKLTGLNNADVTFSRSGNDLFIGINSSGETMKVTEQFNSGGIEQVKFADGTIWDRSQINAASWVRGTAGNDSINGTNGDETFDGGAGNDTIAGAAGSDTYIFGLGSGSDTINEYYYHSGTDTAKLTGLNNADVTFSRSGNDLFIGINSSGETMKVTEQFNSGGIEQVKFADGTLWDRTQISDSAWVRGTAGNDTINGTGGDETIDGGAGNDTIAASTGSDTYIFGVGSGNDTITEYDFQSGTDTAKLIGLNAADVTFTRSGGDLIIAINSSGETLKAFSQFSGTNGLDQVKFADGTLWDRAAIADNSWVRGTAGNDTMIGTSAADNLDGSGGNDTIDGGAGNDRLVGGLGNDTLTGGTGNDIISGGAGTDVATGYSAGWSVVFASGEWAVTNGTETDELHGVEKVVINGTTYVLVDQLGQDIGGYQSLQAGVDAATSGDVVMIGAGSYTQNVSIVDKAITLDGVGRTGPSATTLHGQITVDGLLNGASALKDLAIDATGHQYGVYVSAHSTGLAGSVTLDDVSISHATLDGFAYIRSGNGSTPTLTDTIGSVSILHSEFFGNATQVAGANGRGDILLFGFNGDLTISDVDIHDPGAGAQKALQLRGLQDGSDVSGAGPYDVGGHVSLTDFNVTGTYQQDLLAFYRVAHFASFATDGVDLNASAPWGMFNFDEVGGVIDLSTGVTATNLSGGAIAALQGLASADTFTGTDGNDFIDGRDGADTLNGGAGNDVFIIASTAFYDSGETINGGDGSDSLRFTSTTAGQTLTLTSAVTNIEDIRISNASGVTTGTTALNVDASAVGGSYSLTGNNGANLLTGGSGDNALVGGGGNDTLTGGAGNDTLTGGAGNDGFVFDSNFGHDVITDFVSGAGTNDVIEFHNGLFADFNGVLAAATSSGNDTIITVDANDSIALQNVALASLHQDDFRFV